MHSASSAVAWSPCSSRSLSPCASPANSLKGSWSYDIINLPVHLERHIKVLKSHLPLGVVLDANIDKAINGCVVKSICSKKALAKDGRIQPGDHIVKVNGESLRNVTNAQARAIMRRANLVGAQCGISYITSADAKLWKERLQHFVVGIGTGGICAETASNFMTSDEQQQQQKKLLEQLERSRLSPKVYPKFYRSPILDKPLESPQSEEEPQQQQQEQPGPTTPVDTVAVQPTVALIQQFVDQLLKSIFADAIFDVYILDRSELRARRSVRRPIRSASVAAEADSVPAPSPSLPTIASVRSPPPPKATELRSASSVVHRLIRSASSSLRRKKHRPPASPPISKSQQQIEEAAALISSSRKMGTDGQKTMAQSEKVAAKTMPESAKSMNFWSEPRTVTLSRRHNETFGISIVGGRVEVTQRDSITDAGGTLPTTSTTTAVPICGGGAAADEEGTALVAKTVSGIFIKSVVPDSPAGRSGQLFMGDRVLRVNDTDLSNTTHDYAVQVIKSAKNPVKFVVQSLQSLQAFVPSSHQNANDVLANHGTTSAAAETCAENVESDDIDLNSAAALERLEDDTEEEDIFRYTEGKVLRKYARLPGHPVLIRLRDIPRGGLGLILSATGTPPPPPPASGAETTAALATSSTDVPPTQPQRSVIVVGVKSNSPLALSVGDELLEINGKVLFGLSHHEATAKIKRCCEHNCLTLLVLRKHPSEFEFPSQRERKSTVESECEAGARKIVSEVLRAAAADEQTQAEDVGSHMLDQQQNAKENSNKVPSTAYRTRARTAGDSTVTKGGGSTTVARSSLTTACLKTMNNISDSNNNAPAAATATIMPAAVSEISRKRSWQMEQQQSQQLQKAPIQVGQETLIEIDKDGKGLGLSIVGGSDTVLGTVVIHEVYPDGAAAIDARLKPGDQVLEVNGTSLRGTAHEQAISLLRRTPAKVRLLIYRDVNLQMSMLDPAQIYNILAIELTKKSGKGLGVSIVGRKNEPGVYISEIVKGGVADNDGRLMQGDQILEVNGQNVANCLQEDVATLLKTCTGRVVLKVGRWKLNETAQKVRSAQPPNGTNAVAVGQPQQQPQQMPLQQQQNTSANNTEEMNNNSSRIPAVAEHPPNGALRDPPPPAPMPKLPPPTLQITLHDENNQQQSLVGKTDLSPVSEEDLKSIAETSASEETGASSQRRPLAGGGHLPTASSAASSSACGSTSISGFAGSGAGGSSGRSSAGSGAAGGSSASGGGSATVASAAVMGTVLRSDLKEMGCESVLILLKKDEGQQWGMGIGKRPRGILITSLQPGSSAAEKLAIGDRIMAVNGHEVSTQHSAVTYIRSSGNSVALQVSRPIKPIVSGTSS